MPAESVYIGRLHLSGLTQGWSEVYYLNGNTKAAALTNMTAIITARKAILSDSIALDYANVSQFGVNRDSYIALESPTEGDMTATTWKPNRLADCLLLRQETATGKVSNRYVHGIPDAVIVDQEYDAAGIGVAWTTPLTAFLAALKDNTGFLLTDKTVTPNTHTVVAWDKVVNRGLTGRKVGRPFVTRPGRGPTGS